MAVEASIGLAVVGMLLILAEVFVPGGVVGTIGAILLAAGIVGAFFHSLNFGLCLLLAAMAGGLILFWAWMRYLPKSRVGKRLILQQDGAAWQGYDRGNPGLAGHRGVTKTPLHPTGIALIDGRRIDVVTRGEMIAAGKDVEVVEVEGNRIVVAEVHAEAPAVP